MCGILGFTRYMATPRQVTMALLIADKMVERGRMSWGTTDGLSVTKRAESFGVANIAESHLLTPSAGPLGVVIGHTRAASHGKVNEENAHPHTVVSEDANHLIIGVHNGTLTDSTMRTLNPKNFEVDTKVIYDALVNSLSTDKMEGTGVLSYVQDQQLVRFCRFNSTNLFIIIDDETGGLIWASTEHALESAAKRVGLKLTKKITLDENKIYEVRQGPDHDIIVEIGEQKFAKPIQIVYVDSHGATQYRGTGNQYYGSHAGSSFRSSGICPVCETMRTSAAGIGLCKLCEQIVLSDDSYDAAGMFSVVVHHTVIDPDETEDVITEEVVVRPTIVQPINPTVVSVQSLADSREAIEKFVSEAQMTDEQRQALNRLDAREQYELAEMGLGGVPWGY